MPGRSVSDGQKAGDRPVTGPADRLSLTVSAFLIGGVLLALGALYESAQLDRPAPPTSPKPPKPALEMKTVKTPAPRTASAALSIQLPPPPPPARATTQAAKPAPTPARPPLLKSKERPAPKPRVIEPLKRSSAKPRSSPKRVQPIERPKPDITVAVREPVVKKPRSQPPEKLETEPSEAAADTVADGAAVNGNRNRKTGGALLRLLEHGQGPAIEIAWPRQAGSRQALYRQLKHCYGVRAALLTDRDGLFVAAGTPGKSWMIDRDRFSGFIRSPQGEAIPEEERVFVRIADHHGVAGGRPVRVFPRDVDAALLGGLGAVLGPLYKSARQIHAAYRYDRTRLVLSDFTVDGRPLAGRVILPVPRARARGTHCD